jgi:hypothetical protein
VETPQLGSDRNQVASGERQYLFARKAASFVSAIHRRLRAAIAALPFEHPKLAGVARVNGGGIGDQLEAAIKRAQARRSGPLIEGEATATDPSS